MNADDLSDQRYSAADDSSRLMLLGQRKATSELEVEQAEERAKAAGKESQTIITEWFERLKNAGFPELEPLRFDAWASDRDKALAAIGNVRETDAETTGTRKRRDQARSRLAALFTHDQSAPKGDHLAPLLEYADVILGKREAAAERSRLDASALIQAEQDLGEQKKRRKKLEEAIQARKLAWSKALNPAGPSFDIASATTTLDILDELRTAKATMTDIGIKVEGIEKKFRDHAERVGALATILGIDEGGSPTATFGVIKAKLTAARSAESSLETLSETLDARNAEVNDAQARLDAAKEAVGPTMRETGSADETALAAALELSKSLRVLKDAIKETENSIISSGDGYELEELLAQAEGIDTDSLTAKSKTLADTLVALNSDAEELATEHGDAIRAFKNLEIDDGSAVDAATDAEQARAELSALSEDYILKRTQVVTLRWAIERYRQRHQDPMLVRASELFSILTLGRYSALRIDTDSPSPRLLGMLDDGRTMVEVGAMSEGTTDQLFLALRLAAVERSVASATKLPFLADDLFVNFDDERSEAGFRVLAELAKSTQVLFFTHHPHLVAIASEVVGAGSFSEISLV